MKFEHVPIGNPCQKCGEHAARHRVYHKPVGGDPCWTCGLPLLCHRFERNAGYDERHRTKTRERMAQASGQSTSSPRKRTEPRSMYHHPGEVTYLGIDGEGQGRERHNYIFLACSSENGEFKASVENPEGLSTEACLDFILSLPFYRHKIFAYAFNYDLTKILKDVDNATLYHLFRPDLRQRPGDEAKKGPYYVRWGKYRLNWQGSKFTVACGRQRIVIWDIFKFFQSKFVGAIKDWKVGTPSLWDEMQKMKDKRGEFDKEPFVKVKRYCFEECECMAELARKLTEAHVQAGLKLRSYYGAGSSAAAMLNVMGVREKIIKNYPDEMTLPVSMAFFGGRFENSRVGPVHEKVYNYDISSAYPYQLYFLPCLEHGTWERTTDRRQLHGPSVKHALVRYELVPHTHRAAWGPFPFRMKTGSICFPKQSGGGWVYREEFLQGERLFPYVRFAEAWVYKSECACIPFQKIPEYYAERCRIGKEGPGIVIKLGCNSCYGKLAQSVGNAMFNSWLWAGMITSGTRAQLLELLGLHRDWDNALMMATDGLATLEPLTPPAPLETGTAHATVDGISKPLGGWEEKIHSKGMFLARPGIYFPMNPTEKELKDVRGRGVGKGVVLENWAMIIEAYDRLKGKDLRDKEHTVTVSNVSRFCGAKSSIYRSGVSGSFQYRRADGTGGDGSESAPSYGQWITRKVDMSFSPLPKRRNVGRDGQSLTLRKLSFQATSQPYNKATSEEGWELQRVQAESLEQPDGDLTEYL